jgi:hypothetical protein
MGKGQGQIICYNCAQPGHLARDFHNPCTNCNYCNSFDHVIEECLVLLAKLQKKQGGNQQVQLISAEPHGEDPRVIFITRGGAIIGEYRVTLGNTTEGSWIRRAAKKEKLFDQRRERHTFEEARKKFVEEQAYASKAQAYIRECEMPPKFDQSSLASQGKEVSKLMDFLYTCINLIKYEKVVQELQHLVRQYEIGRIDPLLSRAMNQVSRKRKKKRNYTLVLRSETTTWTM